jgi:hypothetical protein
MADFPQNALVTFEHLDSDYDFIGNARPELHNGLATLKDVVESYAVPNGICPLDASGQIPAIHASSQLTSNSSNPVVLNSGTEVIEVNSQLAFVNKTVAELKEFIGATLGTIAFCSNGDSGAPCIAVASGLLDVDGKAIWIRVPIGNTNISET